MARFDGVSRTELIEFIHELEIQRDTYAKALESALRDGRQYLETATRAQERGTALALKLQALQDACGIGPVGPIKSPNPRAQP